MWVWQKMDFFANEDEGSAALADFELAQAYCVSGYSALISNNANALQAGGSIRACQLPGGSRRQIPGTPDNIYTWVANRATRKRLESNKLKDGAFWSYVPEKIQDFMFRQHADANSTFLYGDAQLPYGMIAYKWADEQSQPQLTVTLNIVLEYITNSNVSPKWMSPCDTERLLELWVGLCANRSNWSENPKHVETIKRWSRALYDKTLGNPHFRDAAIKSAVTLGTLALA